MDAKLHGRNAEKKEQKMESLAIIVPCYNEQEALPLFYKEATRVLEKLNYDYKLLLVNDGSKDHTLEIMKSIAQKDEHVRYLSFSRNFGKEAAMYAGFCNANADYVCVMDADMQDPPSLLPEMLEILHTQDYDSVATRRKNREGEPPIRSWFAHRFYEIINKKHATYYGIAMSVKRICEAIVRDEKSILPVSGMIHGMYGVEDVVLSMPAIVGKNGIERQVPISLDEDEQKQLQKSAQILKEMAEQVL